MKTNTLIKFFFIFFIVFFIIGFSNGKEVVSKKNFLESHILSKICLSKDFESLIYVSKKDSLITFNIDDNNFSRVARRLLKDIKSNELDDLNFINFFDHTILTGIGGGSLGYTLKDVFKNQKKIASSKNKSPIIGIILGVISGYSLGYYVGKKTQIPSENHSSIRTILKDKNQWGKFKWNIYFNIEIEIDKKIEKLNKSPNYRGKIKPLKQAASLLPHTQILVLKNDNYKGLNSKNFKELIKLKNLVDELYQKEFPQKK